MLAFPGREAMAGVRAGGRRSGLAGLPHVPRRRRDRAAVRARRRGPRPRRRVGDGPRHAGGRDSARSGWRWRVAAPAGSSSAPSTSPCTTSPTPDGRISTPPTSTRWSRPSSTASWQPSTASTRARPSVRRWPVPIAAGPAGGMTPAIIDRVYELGGAPGARTPRRGPDGRDRLARHVRPGRRGRLRSHRRGERTAGREGRGQRRRRVGPATARARSTSTSTSSGPWRPTAQILDYEAPNNGGAIAAVIDRIVADGRADIVSISWGSCELNRDDDRRWPGWRARWRPRPPPGSPSSWPAATTAPTTASTRTGPTCRVSVDSPASDVNAIGVGGTFLTMLEDGSVHRRGRLGGAAHRLGAGRRAERLQPAPGLAGGPRRGQRPVERDAPGPRRRRRRRPEQRLPHGQRGRGRRRAAGPARPPRSGRR